MGCCVIFTALLSLYLRSAAKGNVRYAGGERLGVEESVRKSFAAEVMILELSVRRWLFPGKRENGSS